MRNRRICALCASLLLLILACKKDNFQTITTVDPPPEPGVTIESTVQGFVQTFSGEAISDASVKLGDLEVPTNEYGYFRIAGFIRSSHEFIRVSKEGYFNSYPAFSLPKTGGAFLEVQLTERTAPAVISADNGGSVAIRGGGNVIFAANSFVDANGSKYTGDVTVYSTYIDPADSQLNERMSGNLTGFNTTNTSVVLESYGMINVEIEDMSGYPLQIDQDATVRIPVPSELMNSAPSEIPLWYFDESTALWIEEGNAQLTDNEYVGHVSHFSLWNCDVPFELVQISGTVMDSHGPDVFKVCIENMSSGLQRCTHTNNTGEFSGKVPANENLVLSIIDLCGNPAYTENIGPLSQDLDLGTLSVTIPNLNTFEITGVLLDCANEPVPGGSILVVFDDVEQRRMIFDVETDGSLTQTVRFCGTLPGSMDVTGIDWRYYVQGNASQFTVSSQVDLANILACGVDAQEAIVFRFGNSQYVVPNCTVDIGIFDSNTQSVIYDVRATRHFTSNDFHNYRSAIIDTIPGPEYGFVLTGATSSFYIDSDGNPPPPPYKFHLDKIKSIEIVEIGDQIGDRMKMIMTGVSVRSTISSDTILITEDGNAIINARITSIL